MRDDQIITLNNCEVCEIGARESIIYLWFKKPFFSFICTLCPTWRRFHMSDIHSFCQVIMGLVVLVTQKAEYYILPKEFVLVLAIRTVQFGCGQMYLIIVLLSVSEFREYQHRQISAFLAKINIFNLNALTVKIWDTMKSKYSVFLCYGMHDFQTCSLRPVYYSLLSQASVSRVFLLK